MLILPLALAACGTNEETPGAVSPDEARELNEAASALDMAPAGDAAINTGEAAE